MFATREILLTAFICAFLVAPCIAGHESQKFSFPDSPPVTKNGKLSEKYSKICEAMENTSSAGNPKTAFEEDLLHAELNELRPELNKLASNTSDEAIATYARRRLIILDWQTGVLSGLEAADKLRTFGAELDVSERNFSQAMALTIELRERHVERFYQNFPTLNSAETPLFGWFAFEYSQSLLDGYVEEAVTEQQAQSGQPIDEEYQRKLEVAQFLEETFFPAIKGYLIQYKERLSQPEGVTPPGVASFRAKLERVQIVGAMRSITQDIRETLGGRLYLDISERATDVLLPQSLELWGMAVELIEPDGDYLVSPDKNRKSIATFRDGIIPRLKNLQETRRLSQEFAKVISQHKGTIKNFNREELERIAAEQKQAAESPVSDAVLTTGRMLIVICLVVVAVFMILFAVRWMKKLRTDKDE